mgnify:CR=1 FL=1
MKKIVSRGACLLFALCLSLNAVGCQKSNENNKIKEGQSISSEEAGMSINANGKNETFKPSDYTLEAKKEYVYEYLGLKFKLSDKFRNYIADKKIAMLDDQSPIDKELKYAILTFEKMTEEWLDFIVACRQGKSHKYDIVEGPMADDTIYNYIQNYIDGKISRAAFWELAKFNHPTHQISFHTISALDTLKYIGSEVVDGSEK